VSDDGDSRDPGASVAATGGAEPADGHADLTAPPTPPPAPDAPPAPPPPPPTTWTGSTSSPTPPPGAPPPPPAAAPPAAAPPASSAPPAADDVAPADPPPSGGEGPAAAETASEPNEPPWQLTPTPPWPPAPSGPAPGGGAPPAPMPPGPAAAPPAPAAPYPQAPPPGPPGYAPGPHPPAPGMPPQGVPPQQAPSGAFGAAPGYGAPPGPVIIDPHGIGMAVSRLSGGARRHAKVALAVLATALDDGDVVAVLVQGRFRGEAGLVALVEGKVVIVNERQWKPEVLVLPVDAELAVHGWQDDRTASLTFVSGEHHEVVERIGDRGLAIELAQRVRHALGGGEQALPTPPAPPPPMPG
jgi:hypothetical protein